MKRRMMFGMAAGVAMAPALPVAKAAVVEMHAADVTMSAARTLNLTWSEDYSRVVHSFKLANGSDYQVSTSSLDWNPVGCLRGLKVWHERHGNADFVTLLQAEIDRENGKAVSHG